jgi:hypothetical protein
MTGQDVERAIHTIRLGIASRDIVLPQPIRIGGGKGRIAGGRVEQRDAVTRAGDHRIPPRRRGPQVGCGEAFAEGVPAAYAARVYGGGCHGCPYRSTSLAAWRSGDRGDVGGAVVTND